MSSETKTNPIETNETKLRDAHQRIIDIAAELDGLRRERDALRAANRAALEMLDELSLCDERWEIHQNLQKIEDVLKSGGQ